jgi:hypothetical protein
MVSIGRNAGLQVYQNFNILRGIIINFPDFDFAFVVGGYDGVNQRAGSGGKRQFCNGEGFLINFLILALTLTFPPAGLCCISRNRPGLR